MSSLVKVLPILFCKKRNYIVVCSFLQDFSKGKGRSVFSAFLLCGAMLGNIVLETDERKNKGYSRYV